MPRILHSAQWSEGDVQVGGFKMLAEFAGRSMAAALLHPWRTWSRGVSHLSLRYGAHVGGTCTMSSRNDDHTPLLIERMLVLHLDPGEVRRTEGAMFEEFQTLCRRCPSKDECAWSLVHDTADPAWQDWRNYCPNSAKLRMLSALRGCVFDAGE